MSRDPRGPSSLLRPASITQERLDHALKACEQITARDQSNLYKTSQFLEDPSRYQAFVAMYAVMRTIDDSIDATSVAHLPTAQRGRLDRELDTWAARIRADYEGCPCSDPLDVALSAAVLTFPVPLSLWLNFLEAMRFELRHSSFADFSEFLDYAEGATVSPTSIYVFLLTSLKQRNGQYLSDRFDFETCGRKLGLFAYLAHILRDVARDMRDGEGGLVYFSREDLRRHALDETTLRGFVEAGIGDGRWRTLVKDLCIRAHNMEVDGTQLAERQYPLMPPDCAFVLRLIIRTYSDLLRRIAADPDSVLRSETVSIASNNCG